MGRIAHKAYRSKGGGRIMPQMKNLYGGGYGSSIKRVNEPPAPTPADPNTPQNLNMKQRY
jgi:hypothetical protein